MRFGQEVNLILTNQIPYLETNYSLIWVFNRNVQLNEQLSFVYVKNVISRLILNKAVQLRTGILQRDARHTYIFCKDRS